MSTRDIQRLVQEVRNGREPVVLPDGTIETEPGGREPKAEGVPAEVLPNRQRVKPATFGSAGTRMDALASGEGLRQPGSLPVHEMRRIGVAEERVTEGALNLMPSLAARYPNVETGALGLGTDSYTLTELIPSGAAALRTEDAFGLDPDFLNPALEKARLRGLRWVAVWHVHPEGFLEPSSTDREAARALLNDPETGLEGRLLLPISARTRNGIATRFYVAEGPDARIRRISPAVVSDGTNGALGTRGKETAELRSLLLARREERLGDDVEALLKARFLVAQRESASGTRVLRTARDGVGLWFVMPEEYPSSPPETYVEEKESLRVVPARELPALLGWSSSSSVLELAAQAERSVLLDREAEAFRVRPRAFEFLRRTFSTH